MGVSAPSGLDYAKLSSPATAFVYAGLRSGRDPSTYIGSSTNINPCGSADDLRNGLFTAGAVAGPTWNDSFYRIFCVRSNCSADLNADSSKDGTFFTLGARVRGAGNVCGARRACARQRLKRHDTGCGESNGLTKPLSVPGPLAPRDLVLERYQGRTSARESHVREFTDPECGVRYDTYEPPTFRDPPQFPGIKIMALSSTGVTGGRDAGRAGGGIAMA